MKNAPRKPMVSAIITVLVLISPIYAESTSNLEKYLDCSSQKTIDIAFVFDTTNSMGGEINELRATANKFATDLGASNIDYRLGLVEFRDFPETCDGFSCGSPGDYAYSVKGNGTLTSEIDTFGSWLKELKAGGGGSPGPEAVLAALRHAGSDMAWRSDAEKAIIVLTDAGPHPDGSCCNAEGDTLEGTIYGLTDLGARVYVIGPVDASLERISKDTGGQFYEIRSGLSLKPLLEEITKSMSCSFRADVKTACENDQLDVTVQLVGKETIPYLEGQTEVWMYLDQAGSISRFNLSYDSDSKAYTSSVPDVCGTVELTVYGRAGDRSTVQTIQVECDTCGIVAEAEERGTLSISGRIYDDSNGDGAKGADEAGLEGWEVSLLKPDGGSLAQEADRNGYYIFSGLLPGSYKVVANAQENWTVTPPGTGTMDVELIDVHESEIDFGFRFKQYINQKKDTAFTEFNRTFGGAERDIAESMKPTFDGGYILAGVTNSFGAGSEDGWLVKTDSEGIEVWSKTFGGTGTDWVNSVQVTSDGGYIMAGETSTRGWLVKTDSEGNEVWSKTFGDSTFSSVQVASDGGYVLTGGSYLIKTDSEGNVVWSKTFGGDYSSFSSVQVISDGGYVLAGRLEYPPNSRVWLIKTDSEGNEVWNRTYGSGAANSVQTTSDGGYVLVGWTKYSDDDLNHALLIKTDSDGKETWKKILGEANPNSERKVAHTIWSVQIAPDGGYIMAGSITTYKNVGEPGSSENYGDTNAWLIKTDSYGNEVWDKTFGGTPGKDIARDVHAMPDGGYVLAGQANSFGHGSLDFWLLKVDSNGNIVRLLDREV